MAMPISIYHLLNKSISEARYTLIETEDIKSNESHFQRRDRLVEIKR